MTSAQTVDTPSVNVEQSRPKSGGDIAVGFAYQLARENFPRGDLAELRRMKPDKLDKAVFWKLMAEQNLLGNPSREGKWALILNGIALMTPRNPTHLQGSAHDGRNYVGTALFLGGDSQRERGFFSEARLNRLLTARGAMLRTLLTRMFRMLSSVDVAFNWWEMAHFILVADSNEKAAEEARRRIARAYYRAERRSAQDSEKQDD